MKSSKKQSIKSKGNKSKSLQVKSREIVDYEHIEDEMRHSELPKTLTIFPDRTKPSQALRGRFR
jgi:hypothetical protein